MNRCSLFKALAGAAVVPAVTPDRYAPGMFLPVGAPVAIAPPMFQFMLSNGMRVTSYASNITEATAAALRVAERHGAHIVQVAERVNGKWEGLSDHIVEVYAEDYLLSDIGGAWW